MVLVSICDTVEGCDTLEIEAQLLVLANGCDAMCAVRNNLRWILACGCVIVGAESQFQEIRGRRR